MDKKELGRKLFVPLSWLNRRLKKDQQLIFFYSNLGFRDNVKAMFDYLIEQEVQKTYHIVCATNQWEAYDKLAKADPQRYKHVKFVSVKEGIRWFLRAKYGFYCFGKYPIKPSKDQVIVNLWHGMPLKRIGNMEPQYRDIDYNYFTYVLATAPLFQDIMQQVFSCRPEQVLLGGEPRNDELFRRDYSSLSQARTAQLTDEEIRRPYQKIFVWFPTYRNQESTGDKEQDQWPIPLLSSKEAVLLNDELLDRNAKLIVKLHPLQYHEEIRKFSNIEILDQGQMEEEYGSLYRLLRLSDALITDYSSVYFDYLLLDRPMSFTVDDLEQYGDQRGFVFPNPQDYMPGEQVTDYQGLLEFVDHVVSGQDDWKERRQQVNDLVNVYQDGESCRRIWEQIQKAGEE